MQLSSSMTIIPPEPIMDPKAIKLSKSIGVSNDSSVMQPPEGPPVWTALNFLLFGIPPPMS